MRNLWLTGVAWAVLSGAAVAAETDALPFKVRAERPRIWIRAENWDGPNVPHLKEWFKRPEYVKRGVKRQGVLQYVVNGDQDAGGKAVAGLCRMKISGSSPSYSGASAQQMAAYYDWLRSHPDFTDAKRAPVVAHLEKWGDSFLKYVTTRSAPMYYSRYPGAIGGLAVIGLALYGDSPKADAYILGAYKALKEYGRARQYEGGASAGGTYSIFHAFPDLGRAVCAFESATDADLLAFIQKEQGNWIEGQLLWQIWETYPNGYFVKEGDLWQQPDRTQTRMNIDVLTSLLRNGYGRTHADLMHKRWGNRDYHRVYVWNFFVFNNPEIEAKPLAGLGRAKLFGRDSHGYVFFRDGWGPDKTQILFRFGEGYDVHSNRGAGGIDIYRHAVLAERANKDYPKGDDHIKYSNSMIFNGHNQPSTEAKTDIRLDFDQFLDLKKRKGYELATIKAFEATDDYARVLGDLSAAVRQDCRRWTRELVYLGYTYLVVVDRVETLDKPVEQQWLMHFRGETKVDGLLASTVAGGGRLFCRTLLPRNAVLKTDAVGKYTRLAVSPGDPNQRRTVLVHVLYPTEADGTMPEARAVVGAKGITVTVGGLSHVFEGAAPDTPSAGEPRPEPKPEPKPTKPVSATFKPTRDARITCHPSEVGYNNGGANRLRTVGIQKTSAELVLIDFDHAAMRAFVEKNAGREISGRLTLHVYQVQRGPAKVEVAVLDSGADWVEGDKTLKPADKGESCCLAAQKDVKPWTTVDGKSVANIKDLLYDAKADAIKTLANSRGVEVSSQKTVAIDLDGALIRHLATAAACRGLVLFNRHPQAKVDFFSRDQNRRGPALVVTAR